MILTMMTSTEFYIESTGTRLVFKLLARSSSSSSSFFSLQKNSTSIIKPQRASLTRTLPASPSPVHQICTPSLSFSSLSLPFQFNQRHHHRHHHHQHEEKEGKDFWLQTGALDRTAKHSQTNKKKKKNFLQKMTTEIKDKEREKMKKKKKKKKQ